MRLRKKLIAGLAASQFVLSSLSLPQRTFGISSEKSLPILEENAALEKAVAFFPGGRCEVNPSGAPTLTFFYDGKESKKYRMLPLPEVGTLLSVECRKVQTIIIWSKCILLADRGYEGLEESVFKAALGDSSTGFTVIHAKENEEYIRSISSPNFVFVIALDSKTRKHSVVAVDVAYSNYNKMDIQHRASARIDMQVIGDILLIASEAKKGEPYLYAINAKSTKKEVLKFLAKTNITGKPALVKTREGELSLTIGKFKRIIRKTSAQTKDSGSNLQCFEPTKDGIACISVSKE
ncbi:MAG: hypothetical protein QW171_04705 [Candidatus Bilamarchaeaceae archaeon]